MPAGELSDEILFLSWTIVASGGQKHLTNSLNTDISSYLT